MVTRAGLNDSMVSPWFPPVYCKDTQAILVTGRSGFPWQTPKTGSVSLMRNKDFKLNDQDYGDIVMGPMVTQS